MFCLVFRRHRFSTKTQPISSAILSSRTLESILRIQKQQQDSFNYPCRRPIFYSTLKSSAYATHESIVGLKKNLDGRTATLTFPGESQREASDVHSFIFDAIWLRDHCRCPVCYHPTTHQRMIDTFELDPEVRVSDISSVDAEHVQVLFSDGHRGLFPIQFLVDNARCKDMNSRESERGRVYTTGITGERRFWAEEMSDPEKQPTVAYQDVMHEDEAVYQWIRNIDMYGIGFVNGVPVDPTATENLSKRIAFVRPTHYGGFWDFTSDLAASDTAYTNLGIAPHTDGTYFSDPPGYQLFHLLHFDGQGGQNTFVDGFRMAQEIATKNPDAFDLLSSQQIPSAYLDLDASQTLNADIRPAAFAHPVFCRRTMDNLVYQVRLNNTDRLPLQRMQNQKEFYKVYIEVLGRTLKSLEVPVTLRPGTVVAFDNHRLLHARTAFQCAGGDGGKGRRMCGCYFFADDVVSRMRALHLRYGS